MKIRVERDDLAKAIATVKRSANTSAGSTPITASVQIVAGKTIAVTATNLDVTCTTDLPGTVLDAGTTVPRLALVSDIVAVLQPGAVDLTADTPGELTIATKRDTHVIRCMDPNDYPRMKRADGTSYELTAEHCAAIRRVIPAASTVTERSMILTGVHFHGAIVEATDSYRMHRATLDGVNLPSIIIPAAALGEALGHVDDNGATIDVDDSTKRLTVTTTDGSWTLHPLAGDYPNVAPLLDRALEGPHTITANRDDLAAALKRLRPVAARAVGSDGKPGDPLARLRVDGGELRLTASVQDSGSSVVTCDGGGTFDGDIAFNAAYLAGLLAACPDATVELAITDNLKPAVAANGGMQLLVMPVRVS